MTEKITPAMTENIKPAMTENITPAMTSRWSAVPGKVGSALTVSLPVMMVGGVAVLDADGGLKSLRDSRLPNFSTHIDDYLQFSPGAVMLALKAAGVRGRSSWAEMLTASSAAYLIMGGSVKSLKTLVSVERPDGSDVRSFPSGHSARAFMMAGLLTREYGELSPWVGAGAYSLAAATGVMRIANDRHWLSDVLTGAGLGVLSAEAGYLISDLIFGKDRQDEELPDEWKSSFIGLYTGTGWLFGGASGRSSLRSSHAGLEGAYFWNERFGLGGRALLSYAADSFSGGAASAAASSSLSGIAYSSPSAVSSSSLYVALSSTLSSGGAASADFASICSGVYFRERLGRRVSLGSKALAGYFRQTGSSCTAPASEGNATGVSASSGSLNTYGVVSKTGSGNAPEVAATAYDAYDGTGLDLGGGLDLCAGLSLDIRLRDSYGLRLFADCDYLPFSSAALLTFGFSFNLLLR